MNYRTVKSVIRVASSSKLFCDAFVVKFVGFYEGRCYYWFVNLKELTSTVVSMDLIKMGDKTYDDMVVSGDYELLDDEELDVFYIDVASQLDWKFANPSDVLILVSKEIKKLEIIRDLAHDDLEKRTNKESEDGM